MAAERDALRPIGGQSVVDKTINIIMEAISDGTYKAGSKLPNEYDLVSELQISRNSLREAMRVLVTLGVVEIRRGDGTYVCDQINPSMFDSMVYGLVFDASSSVELIELRQALDEIMLKIAVEKATDEDIKKLENLLQEMEYSFTHGDAKRASEADFEFHMVMVDITNNKLLSRIIKGVYQFFKTSIHVNIETEEQYAHACEYHTELLRVIKNKDRSMIEGAVSNSLESWKKHIR